MKIKAIITDVTKTSSTKFTEYSKESVDNGIDCAKVYMVVCNGVVIGSANVKYDFPVLEITANCHGIMTVVDAAKSILERSGITWGCDENNIITNWELCNFTLRELKDGETTNIVEFDN